MSRGVSMQSAEGPQILGPNGAPLAPSRASALANSSRTPYDAADMSDPELAAWRPYLTSSDAEINIYRDRIVSRIRDLVRNDGWASAGVTRILDNAIGAAFRPVAKPDHRMLARYTGNSAFDADWASEFARWAEAWWRTFANDPGRYCDTGRRMTMPQLFRLAFRHSLVDDDALAILQWLPGRIAPGRAQFATAVQIVDPDRLSNPHLRFDSEKMRGGVEVDAYGAAVAYHIRDAHPGDWWSARKSVTWSRVLRETPTGRPIVVHYFEHDRADQHRGGAGIFAPILARMKMLSQYDRNELQASIVNAIFGAYITSPFDQSLVQDALGDNVSDYQTLRADFHGEARTKLNDVRMPILFPGEEINSVNAARPTSNFAEFENQFLRNAAGALGLSAQQLSNNWSDVNYSSARGALLEAWKTLTRRRLDFGTGFCSPIYGAVLEEAMEFDDVPLPADAPPFYECRAAYAGCKWIGPGRGWIDPVDEKAGAIMGMEAGLSTLEDEAAENAGADWEDILDQRQREMQAFKERGLEPPSWAAAQSVREAVRQPEQPREP